MSKFIAASRQATELDKMRILLEKTIKSVRDKSKKWAGIAAEAKEKAAEQQNLIAELRADIVEKDTRLDHIQKKNDELSIFLSKAKEDAVAEFKESKAFTDLLDHNYAAGFEDFKMDAVENFLEVDFSSIKLNLNVATNSLLQTSSEDDASTQPSNVLLLKNKFLQNFISLCLVLCFGIFWCNSNTLSSSTVSRTSYQTCSLSGCLDVGCPPLKQLNGRSYFSFIYAWTKFFIFIHKISRLTRPYLMYVFKPFLLEFQW